MRWLWFALSRDAREYIYKWGRRREKKKEKEINAEEILRDLERDPRREDRVKLNPPGTAGPHADPGADSRVPRVSGGPLEDPAGDFPALAFFSFLLLSHSSSLTHSVSSFLLTGFVVFLGGSEFFFACDLRLGDLHAWGTYLLPPPVSFVRPIKLSLRRSFFYGP